LCLHFDPKMFKISITWQHTHTHTHEAEVGKEKMEMN